MHEGTQIQELREQVERLLDAALRSEAAHSDDMKRRDEAHLAATERRDEAHIAETGRRDEAHIAELGRRDQLHVDEMALLATAIESRDTIGQAKGVIIVTMGCSADEAFRLLKEQSQHENRKLVEVAADIVAQAQRKHRHG